MKTIFPGKLVHVLGLTAMSLAVTGWLAGSASGLILADKSDAQKLRKGIQKQQTKFIDCIVKAALKCEKSGDQISPPEGDLSTGTATPPADSKGAFVADIAQCDSKVDYTKKLLGDVASDYDAMGCPGDSVPGGSDQPYADLLAYQTGAIANGKDQVDTLGAVLAGAAADPSVCGSEPTAEDQNKCGVDLAKRTSQYAK